MKAKSFIKALSTVILKATASSDFDLRHLLRRRPARPGKRDGAGRCPGPRARPRNTAFASPAPSPVKGRSARRSPRPRQTRRPLPSAAGAAPRARSPGGQSRPTPAAAASTPRAGPVPHRSAPRRAAPAARDPPPLKPEAPGDPDADRGPPRPLTRSRDVPAEATPPAPEGLPAGQRLGTPALTATAFPAPARGLPPASGRGRLTAAPRKWMPGGAGHRLLPRGALPPPDVSGAGSEGAGRPPQAPPGGGAAEGGGRWGTGAGLGPRGGRQPPSVGGKCPSSPRGGPRDCPQAEKERYRETKRPFHGRGMPLCAPCKKDGPLKRCSATNSFCIALQPPEEGRVAPPLRGRLSFHNQNSLSGQRGREQHRVLPLGRAPAPPPLATGRIQHARGRAVSPR
ncbi:nascent polypeptide-associated complex subunit alpha, muscle-specific form-like [Aquila chrysaetos chrysaetos]|uniref:nascent polypeptide-associated complex subunit alpha, muscle-specific form-like n=1 Tax=Aquila chrysaetos chrysaetos TaxID=223781 RepID=UPI001176B0A7|nr:nascent polypeptide-associated complex subunit alpha, muscle-specific form-like [Aquila chrysaetos chrysaetos]